MIVNNLILLQFFKSSLKTLKIILDASEEIKTETIIFD